MKTFQWWISWIWPIMAATDIPFSKFPDFSLMKIKFPQPKPKCCSLLRKNIIEITLQMFLPVFNIIVLNHLLNYLIFPGISLRCHFLPNSNLNFMTFPWPWRTFFCDQWTPWLLGNASTQKIEQCSSQNERISLGTTRWAFKPYKKER